LKRHSIFDKVFALFAMELYQKYFEGLKEDHEPSLGVQVLNLGHYIHPAQQPYPPKPGHPASHYFEWEKGRSLTEFQIVYISSGQGYFEANGQPERSISSGTIILIYPGVWHRYRPNTITGWEEYWVGFSGQYVQYLLEQECFSPQKPILEVGFNRAFFECFSRLITTMEAPQRDLRKLASFHLIQLLGIVYASALISHTKRSHKDEIIERIQAYIHQYWNQTNIDFSALAKSNGVSYAWFRKAFKELLQVSPNQYHLMLKLRKAEQMIIETNLSLSDIAFSSGFESLFYFSRIYKAKMHQNPSAIRKSKLPSI
jgi:transcriptional regulator GlxA family with amidase domain